MSVTRNDTTADNTYNMPQGPVGNVETPQAVQGVAQVTPSTSGVSSTQPIVPVTPTQDMTAKDAVPVDADAVSAPSIGTDSNRVSGDKNATKGVMTGGRRSTLERKLNSLR